jgi:hypothetical protein
MSTTVVQEQKDMAENGAAPYANGMELLQHLCQLLDERLVDLVEEMPAVRQRGDFNLSGMVVSDQEAKQLLGGREQASIRFRSGSLWQATEERRASSQIQGANLPLAIVQERSACWCALLRNSKCATRKFSVT